MGTLTIFLSIAVAIPAAPLWRTGFWNAERSHREPISEIPYSAYSHIVHNWTSPAPDCTLMVDSNRVSVRGFEADELTARAHAAGVKVLLSLTDQVHGSLDVCAAPENIDRFVKNVLAYVSVHHYDGLDVDWEFQPNPELYTVLLDKLHAARTRQLLTIDVNPIEGHVAPALNPHVDQVNVMCYDLDWSTKETRYNTYLKSHEQNSKGCNSRLEFFVRRGVPPGRLGLGIPFYGRRWVGAGRPWQAGRFEPPLGSRITVWFSDLISDPLRWQDRWRHWDPEYEAEYLSPGSVSPAEFISYTGPRQIQAAVDVVRDAGYGGLMVYALPYEYLSQRKGDERYPLTSALTASVRAGAGQTRTK